ncbi:XrtA-associated tyrosine autokinase [Oceanibacterium hippocampi]|uniref:non-specific protein-tyrosine kinase n=1 Tax=Oceanibacterium hippocampi TaxID=745714 RepID=A0A1Y5TPQ7_9PROT|nr:XrtA-associated tyrosine autokinase [Oceanibacterium hippocampi]SLN69110.1 Tyrosine-protein kinase ptk [Oceanibacterium hippocampi]
MNEEKRQPDLIGRAAARLSGTGDRKVGLMEKAAQRLAEQGKAATPSAPPPAGGNGHAAASAPERAPAPEQRLSQSGARPSAEARKFRPREGDAGTGKPSIGAEAVRPTKQDVPPVEAATPAPAAKAAADAKPADGAGNARKTMKFATLDLVNMQLKGMVTPTGDRMRIIEEYRIIKRPLLKDFVSGERRIRNGNLIMVTSVRPKEGKTFTAVNLAMSIASERDLNVLLVDADIHRRNDNGSAMALLDVQDELGLCDVLADPQIDLADVLIRTNIPNLSLLPAGSSTHTNPTELFSSNRMGALIADMSKRYSDRIIIFDAPPVLASSEPSVLAEHVGQVLFVVEAEKTNQSAISQALMLIKACPNISLMLNKARYDMGGESFGSYAGYYQST